MNIGWPEGIYIGLAVINLTLTAIVHGEDRRPSKHSFPISFMAMLLTGGLLFWGGFFA